MFAGTFHVRSISVSDTAVVESPVTCAGTSPAITDKAAVYGELPTVLIAVT